LLLIAWLPDAKRTASHRKQLQMRTHALSRRRSLPLPSAEANAKYDEMRRLDARALELANSLGCPSCRKPSSGAAGATPAAAGDAAADYISLHPVTPWPAQGAFAFRDQDAIACIVYCAGPGPCQGEPE
jgi:hypothetical protein